MPTIKSTLRCQIRNLGTTLLLVSGIRGCNLRNPSEHQFLFSNSLVLTANFMIDGNKCYIADEFIHCYSQKVKGGTHNPTTECRTPFPFQLFPTSSGTLSYLQTNTTLLIPRRFSFSSESESPRRKEQIPSFYLALQ